MQSFIQLEQGTMKKSPLKQESIHFPNLNIVVEMAAASKRIIAIQPREDEYPGAPHLTLYG
ncbi:hypothetical protein EAF00_010675 [Botryotinia globosa]|nr:hypothetical protein EAF00_010675 [Botryotinia globosa]